MGLCNVAHLLEHVSTVGQCRFVCGIDGKGFIKMAKCLFISPHGRHCHAQVRHRLNILRIELYSPVKVTKNRLKITRS